MQFVPFGHVSCYKVGVCGRNLILKSNCLCVYLFLYIFTDFTLTLSFSLFLSHCLSLCLPPSLPPSIPPSLSLLRVISTHTHTHAGGQYI